MINNKICCGYNRTVSHCSNCGQLYELLNLDSTVNQSLCSECVLKDCESTKESKLDIDFSMMDIGEETTADKEVIRKEKMSGQVPFNLGEDLTTINMMNKAMKHVHVILLS